MPAWTMMRAAGRADMQCFLRCHGRCCSLPSMSSCLHLQNGRQMPFLMLPAARLTQARCNSARAAETRCTPGAAAGLRRARLHARPTRRSTAA